jgi:predicted RNA-binding Zn ribbon-like protein
VDVPFSSGRPVLDLLGTLSDRGSADVERLRSWRDVEGWVRGAGVHVDDLDGDDGDLPRVRALREALYRLVTARMAGTVPAEADRRTVNGAAAAAVLTPQLTGAGEVRWTGGLEGVLGAVARDGLDLLASPDLRTLRECADAHCTRLFVDRSRGGRRRWCGMKGCGDRAKAAAYRRRHRPS